MIVYKIAPLIGKPALADQVRINSFIEQSINETIIIFSKQLWYNLTVNEPKLNGKVTLKEDLNYTLDFEW